MIEQPESLVGYRRWRDAQTQDSCARYLIDKYGISADQAQDLIEQYGYRRARLDAAARRLAD
jgi:hypothetical protein